ncbi:MAG: RecX family transcriptional regulator [Flavobacteriales bacterium]|nr:RecX family transcriptional regulator [Flavobacteriales bacterium]MDW8432778.1 RecX family transcriptional regulator [Flavobacteriales bacterium]
MTSGRGKSRNSASESSTRDYDFEKILRFCNFRPRHRYEVEKKMVEMGLCESIRKKYLRRLEKDGLLQDDVFLEAYILGKLRNNRWGRLKIAYQLKQQGFSSQVINKAFKKYIDPEEYLQVARTLCRMRYHFFLKKKFAPGEISLKCINYLVGKGFEMEVCKAVCQEFGQAHGQ